MIILASQSPRRRELMKLLGVDFRCISSDAEENADGSLPPEEYVCLLSSQKAESVSKNNPGITVIGADTVVVSRGKILGKPADENEAFQMLRALSGKCHQVYTGVCITNGKKKKTFFEKTDVYFLEISDEEIKEYIKTGEPMDKAGAYGIQGKACVFIEKIHGDYFNVVGFPLSRISRELKNF